MKRPVEKGDIEELRKLGIEVYDSYKIPEAHQMSVLLEVEVAPEFIIEEDFAFVLKNKRGFPLLINNFKTTKRGEFNILSCMITAGTDEELPMYSALDKNFTSFVDLCWLLGNEKIDRPAKIEEIDFPIAEGYVAGDLGWKLPSRFMDPLIQGLGVLNEVIFQGALKDAVIYGVFKQ